MSERRDISVSSQELELLRDFLDSLLQDEQRDRYAQMAQLRGLPHGYIFFDIGGKHLAVVGPKLNGSPVVLFPDELREFMKSRGVG